MPKAANGIDLQWNLRRARGESYELELHRGVLPKKDGIVRLLAFTNYANMGVYREVHWIKKSCRLTTEGMDYAVALRCGSLLR